MSVRLPPRLYLGTVRRVVDLATVMIDIELDAGVSILRTVRLEGAQAVCPPAAQRADAVSTLIGLLGGKDVYVLSEPTTDQTVLGRVFLRRPVKAPSSCGVSCPPGLDVALLEAVAAMLFLRQHEFRKETLFALLNGHLEGANL